jgi:glutathione S-transferase
MPRMFGYIEKLLCENNGGNGWLVGNSITVADVCLYQWLHDIFVRPIMPEYANDLDGFPKLKAYEARF